MTDLDVVYDGECPFCSGYVELLRLRERGINVLLFDARDPATFRVFPGLTSRQLDRGMAVQWQGRFYEGAQAVQLISQLSRRAPFSAALKQRLVVTLTYPVFRAARRLALLVRRRPTLADDPRLTAPDVR